MLNKHRFLSPPLLPPPLSLSLSLPLFPPPPPPLFLSPFSFCPDVSPSRSLPILSEETIKYLLSVLRQDDDASLFLLTVFKSLHGLSEGVGGLSDPDVELLKNIVKKREKDIQEILSKRGKCSIRKWILYLMPTLWFPLLP